MLEPSVDLSDRKLCQGKHRSKSWRSKSINEQITILPLISVEWVLRKRSILKGNDISRNQVPSKTRTITLIPLLNSKVTKEDTLQWLKIKFRHMRTDMSNKTNTSKYRRLDGKQGFIWKNCVIQSVPILRKAFS